MSLKDAFNFLFMFAKRVDRLSSHLIFNSFSGKECLLSNTEGQNMNIMLKNSSGIFKTPGFPGDYPHILINECVWKIVAATGKVVKVAFSSFQLFQYDCVTIVDGINTADPVIDTRCGSEASFTVYSSGPEMTIKTRGLYTDDTGPGFMANYTMIPGKEKNPQ